MTNLEVIRAFINKEEGHSLHITSENNKLFSYATCIAQWYDDKIIINCTKYSLNIKQCYCEKFQAILRLLN